MRNGKELARAMESFINGANSVEIEDFAHEFTRMHNTLEQMAVGMLFKTLEQVSKHKYTDGRNEACVKASKLMLKGYQAELIKDLVETDDYWSIEKATQWVTSGGYDISKMPLV
jgi:pantothenate kinase type III